MAEISRLWFSFLDSLMGAVNTIKPTDIADWLVTAFLIFHAVRLVRETRAMQLIKGIAAVLLAYFLASWLKMNTLSFVLETIVRSGVVLLAILFQPELRRALEQMGRSKIRWFGLFGSDDAALHRERYEALIKIICESCAYLSERNTGALIVIERETKLGEIIKTGTTIDSTPSVELIANIFFTNSPLHDGAMVLRAGRLYAAGCYLPLSSNMEIGRELGTRHRAALGMSEVSDAVVLVVSEETGAVSTAIESRLQRGISPDELSKLLYDKLLGRQDDSSDKKPAFRRAKK